MTSDQETPTKEESSRPAARSAPGVALRIILVLLVGTVIGAVVYFSAAGWIPYIDQRILEPIDNNQTQLQQLSASQQALAEQVAGLSATLDAFQESENPARQSTMSALENDLASLSDQVDNLSESSLENTYLSATYLPSRLSTLEARQESTAGNLSALATAQMNDPLGREDIEYLRILELLSRSTQFLLHENYGLARDQLLAASDYLEQLDNSSPGIDSAMHEELLSQIKGAIQDLPSRPDIAGLKVELAWNLAMEGIQTHRKIETITPTTTQPTPGSGTATPTPN